MKIPFPSVRLMALSTIPLILAATPLLRGGDGPSPFPDPKDEAAWPGKGPVRVFPYMNDNRAWFWTQQENDQGAVVFVGDSLFGGWEHEAMEKSFPGLKIANRGIGGDCSRSVLFRFREDVLSLKPGAVVFCVGTNDLSAHGDPADVEENIRTMIAQARETNPAIPIVLCTLPPRDVPDAPVRPGALAEVNSRIASIGAGNEKMVVLDFYTPLAAADGMPVEVFFMKDKIHPSPAGYRKWAEMLRPALAKLGVK